jgi:hypothetical protein
MHNKDRESTFPERYPQGRPNVGVKVRLISVLLSPCGREVSNERVAVFKTHLLD